MAAGRDLLTRLVRRDHGASGISTIYAAKTGTTAQPPFNRRILLGFGGWTESKVTKCGNVYLLPKELSMSSAGKLLQHPTKEMVGLRKTAAVAPALAPGGQVEVLVQCPMPAVPKAGVLGVRTLLASGKNQSVQVGYNFSASAGFAAVSASLSSRGARTDMAVLPATWSTAKMLELRVFVDGCVWLCTHVPSTTSTAPLSHVRVWQSYGRDVFRWRCGDHVNHWKRCAILIHYLEPRQHGWARRLQRQLVDSWALRNDCSATF